MVILEVTAVKNSSDERKANQATTAVFQRTVVIGSLVREPMTVVPTTTAVLRRTAVIGSLVREYMTVVP